MGNDKRFSKLIVGGVAGAAAAAGYVLAIRPRMLTWGATKDEAARSLPGDELVPNPRMEATHAITIRASAPEVWPWLVQADGSRVDGAGQLRHGATDAPWHQAACRGVDGGSSGLKEACSPQLHSRNTLRICTSPPFGL